MKDHPYFKPEPLIVKGLLPLSVKLYRVSLMAQSAVSYNICAANSINVQGVNFVQCIPSIQAEGVYKIANIYKCDKQRG